MINQVNQINRYKEEVVKKVAIKFPAYTGAKDLKFCSAKINRELTKFHKEVLSNYKTVHGYLLFMNRSIRSEGAFGVIKQDRNYKRLFQR